MKANELMIGDWLHLHYCNKFEGEVHKNFRVGQIRNDYGEICVWAIKDGSGIYGNMGELETRYGETHISPIPLTPEILEKNGWVSKLDGSGDFYLTEPMAGNSAVITKTITGFDLRHGVFNGLAIHHVHELQHALRLCGIEKEIVL